MHFVRALSRQGLYYSRAFHKFPNTSQLPHLVIAKPFSSTSRVTMPNKHNKKDTGEHIDNEHSASADQSHQFQSGTSTNRKEDEWKHREPYKIHGDDDKFPTKWKGHCHCGKVQYQLKREKPLASKFCHCTTCQRLHGVSNSVPLRIA